MNAQEWNRWVIRVFWFVLYMRMVSFILAELDLCCFAVCSLVVCGLLTAVVSPVVEHRL